MGIFENKVVIITGAGGGIGRAHALAFAREGAKVVVNDLGSAPDGTGSSVSLADKVVEEIRNSGGTAEPNYDSVASMEGGENIVKTALDKFGRIDVLINNAGILRDKTIIKMEEKNWDIVLAVHLKGTFSCTRAAARVMKEQGTGGRIINTSSVAGLMGNFGQCNYGSAKAGIYGFTKIAALEFKRFGVTVNCIAPMAKTRLTADVDAVPEEMVPEQVTPLVLYLASGKAADITGRIFGVHGLHLFEYKMITSPGVEKEGKEEWTIEEINSKFADITDFPAGGEVQEEEAAKGPGIDELFTVMSKAFRADKAPGWSAQLHFSLEGADDWVVTVTGDKATTSKEIPEKTSCVIKMSADTMMGLITGKVDPTKAFMAGDIKASNLPELMKFNKAFSFGKLKTLLEEGEKETEAAPGLSDAFQNLPSVFAADKAGDWAATIHFDIIDDEKQTLKVENQKCEVNPGLVGTPDCVITVKKEALEGMMAGTVDGTKAFMAGDIKASNLSILMKFNKLFSLKALAKTLKTKPVKRVEEDTAITGLDPAIVGRFYTGVAEHVKPERIRAYAKATNETNQKYFVEKDSELVVPPVYPVTALIAPMRDKILVDDSLNLNIMRMVHGEHEITYYRPLKPWDLVYTTVELESIDKKHSGDLLWAKVNGLVEGKLVYDMRAGFFFKKVVKEPKPEKEKTVEEKSSRELVLTRKMVVTQDQSKRYADASGDDNPVHLDKEAAQVAGLPDIFLQGLCTLAFATQAVVDGLAGGDPTRIKRVRTRFSKPVFMQDTLTTEVWLNKEGEGVKLYGFETKNQDGLAVLTRGEVKVKE